MGKIHVVKVLKEERQGRYIEVAYLYNDGDIRTHLLDESDVLETKLFIKLRKGKKITEKEILEYGSASIMRGNWMNEKIKQEKIYD